MKIANKETLEKLGCKDQDYVYIFTPEQWRQIVEHNKLKLERDSKIIRVNEHNNNHTNSLNRFA